ncbi:Rossmann-like domain-containing protein [Hippea maritima]|uniref:Putative heavy-metal chelation domain-containing protein n=1 Tax=Hippea maritima (strain ATCC 700847 / DSM 10411 / MH2) TaxID=760142 RepID=F2LUU3_HIPMA|nr:DUF364 domain-containing protein [Hippea maritima]AEA33548.1 hypothetical protein Hipma_0578 [Hippea maritima DSM 10411]
MGILDDALLKFRDIVQKNGLLDKRIQIKMRPLKPYEAIGKPTRDDYPLLKGKEVLVEATFLEAKGQAFTDEPSDFEGFMCDVLKLPLKTNRNRAVVIASINAVLRYLNMTWGTVHCKDSEPEGCANEMMERFFRRWGENVTLGLVGLQPALASSAIKVFGKGNVKIADLDEDNIGKDFEGVKILDGKIYSNEIVANSFLALITGSSVVNGTIDELLNVSRMDNKNRIVIFYGTTIAGVASLMNLNRLCFRSH